MKRIHLHTLAAIFIVVLSLTLQEAFGVHLHGHMTMGDKTPEDAAEDVTQSSFDEEADDETDNYDDENVTPGDEDNLSNKIHGQSLSKLNNLQRAVGSGNGVPVSHNIARHGAGDLSSASSNTKSNGHQGFFQYARMPAEGAWEFGYRRGNHDHFTERHEHGASHHFKSKVRWGDKQGGYGEHYFDFNHKGTGDDAHVLQRNQQIKSHFSAPNYAAASSLTVPSTVPVNNS